MIINCTILNLYVSVWYMVHIFIHYSFNQLFVITLYFSTKIRLHLQQCKQTSGLIFGPNRNFLLFYTKNSYAILFFQRTFFFVDCWPCSVEPQRCSTAACGLLSFQQKKFSDLKSYITPSGSV